MDTTESMGVPATKAQPAPKAQPAAKAMPVATNGAITVSVEPPRMVLNRYMGSTAHYEIVNQTGDGLNKEYTAKTVVQGQDFFGVGPSHKSAIKDAAVNALYTVFKVKYKDPAAPEPDQITTSGEHPCNLLNKKLGFTATYEFEKYSDTVEEEVTEEGKKIRQSKVRVDIDDRSFYGIGNTFKLAKKAAAIEALFNAYKVKYEEPATVTPEGFSISVEHPCNVLNRKLKDTVAQPATLYEVVEQKGEGPGKEFTVKVTVENQDFFGVGPNQKAARKEAATKALLNVFRIKYQEPALVPAANGFTVTGENPCQVLILQAGHQVEYHKVTFTAKVNAGGQDYYGDGQNHKMAKAQAAINALLSVYKIRYDPSQSHCPVSTKAQKRKLQQTSFASVPTPLPVATGNFGEPQQKKKKVKGPTLPPNALTQMNQVRKDATYVYLDPEQEEGNPKVAIYVCQLEVDGQSFVGRGKSKKQAKHAVAELALQSLNLSIPN